MTCLIWYNECVYHPHQHMASQMIQRGYRDLQAWHCSTGHRFQHQPYLANPYYGPKDLLYPKSTTQPWLSDLLHVHLKSTTVPPLCLLTTDSVQFMDPSPTNFPSAHFNALILQHPVFTRSSSSLLKQQHLWEASILPMTIRVYWSKCGVVTSSSFHN